LRPEQEISQRVLLAAGLVLNARVLFSARVRSAVRIILGLRIASVVRLRLRIAHRPLGSDFPVHDVAVLGVRWFARVTLFARVPPWLEVAAWQTAHARERQWDDECAARVTTHPKTR